MPLLFVPLGDNEARAFGIGARDRACRIAAGAGFECADAIHPGRAALVSSLDFAWDPAWLTALAERPATVLTLAGKPVLAHVAADAAAATAMAAIGAGKFPKGYDVIDGAATEPSKRSRPFIMRLDPADPGPVEHAAFSAAYPGVTDVLTLHVWRKPAFYLTRWAARAGLSPNLIKAIYAILCILVFFLFWHGDYWLGIVSGFVVMVLDPVDETLARCTGASSTWGTAFGRSMALIHPPLWWWAWAHGLAAYGRPLAPIYATMVLWAIVGGYVAQRLIEAIFMRRFGGMPIHVWRKIDGQVRLVTAARNPNMVILVGALLFARPDIGLQLVAGWTLVSLIFHAVRLAQATEQAARGRPIISWLDAA